MKKHLIIIKLIFGIGISLYSQTYYIDYENGNDSNNGTTPETAWKHCLGDVNATSNPSTISIGAGSTLLFKGGINYRGTINFKHSGTADAVITYKGDGWGTEKAIIDGSDVIATDWHQCQSADEAGGNPNYQNIYYTSINYIFSPFVQLFENGLRAYIAQTPNITDPFWDDKISEYYTVLNGNITRTSIKDDSFLVQSTSDYWNGAYVQIWIQPNVINIKNITAFDPESHTIFYDSLPPNAIYGDRNQYYSIVNHISALDRQGEYVVDEANGKIYYWPYGNIKNCVISIGTRSYGLGINGKNNICVEGFKIQGNTNDNAAYAIWNNITWGNPAKNIIIRNNEITHIRTKDGRNGAISFSNVDGLIIANNYIHDCQRNSGIVVGSKNTIIKNNIIKRVGYKGIWSMGSNHLKIINNTITECEGTHGNPVSVFTTKNSLTANNYLSSTGEIYTFERDTNMIVHNNIMFGILNNGQETGTNIIRQNASETNYDYGYIIITNNTLLNSNNNNAIGISQYFEDLSKVIIVNNISDGGPGLTSSMSMSRSYNLYTGLNWGQEERYGWSLMEGEFIEQNLDTIFTDHSEYDFHLKENSVARNKGINPFSVIPQEIKDLFFDFDFSLDYFGNSRGNDGLYDIGAIEYNVSVNGLNKNYKIINNSLAQNYPNPFNTSTTISFELKESSNVKLAIYDYQGREIITLVNGRKEAGKYDVEWDGKNSSGFQVPSGVYFYQLQYQNGYKEIRKMILLNK